MGSSLKLSHPFELSGSCGEIYKQYLLRLIAKYRGVQYCKDFAAECRVVDPIRNNEMNKTKLKKQNDIFVIIFKNLSCHFHFPMAQIRDAKLLQKIALVIKELREARNLTQEDVYNDTNIHVGRIETAKANLSVSTLSALCKYFKIRISEFHKRVEDL